MRKINLFVADTLFVFHCLLGAFILFGWLFPRVHLLYLVVLILWPLCWVFLGYCPPTKWEFTLRRKYDKTIDPNAEAIEYYMYKFFKKRVKRRTVFTVGVIIWAILLALAFFAEKF